MNHALPPKSFVGRLWSGRLDEWELHRCLDPADSCPFRTGVESNETEGTERRCLDIRTADDAMERLRVCVTHSDDMAMLRSVLRDSSVPLSRMTNHQALELV